MGGGAEGAGGWVAVTCGRHADDPRSTPARALKTPGVAVERAPLKPKSLEDLDPRGCRRARPTSPRQRADLPSKRPLLNPAPARPAARTLKTPETWPEVLPASALYTPTTDTLRGGEGGGCVCACGGGGGGGRDAVGPHLSPARPCLNIARPPPSPPSSLSPGSTLSTRSSSSRLWPRPHGWPHRPNIAFSRAVHLNKHC